MTSRRGEPWTDAEVEQLVAHVTAGKSFARVSKLMGRTLDAVVCRHKKYKQDFGLVKTQKPVWSREEYSKATEMRARGATLIDIAHDLGRSVSSVHCKLTRQRDENVFAIPDHVLADRDRRLALRPCDLTALLMGDPVR